MLQLEKYSVALPSIHNIVQMGKKLNRIKTVLVDKDMSQTQLAVRLGKSFSTVNGYCCNRQQPNLETLESIAKILGVSIKDLINE